MIRQISVGNLCGKLGEMFVKLQYSPDSLRRYNKVLRSMPVKRNIPSSLGLSSLPGSLTRSVDSSQPGHIQRTRCIIFGLSAPLLSIITLA